jgi:hypothetical protein
MKVTVSGSFRRHMAAIYDAVNELVDLGVDVLSPADPRVVDQIGEFVFVASDRVRSIKMVEDRHLECILASDFLWLVTPDGYVGQSASMELGYAIARLVPIFSADLPADGTLQKYVNHVRGIAAAMAATGASQRMAAESSFLVGPVDVIDQAHARLDVLRSELTRSAYHVGDDEGEQILRERSALAGLIAPAGQRKRTSA